MLDEKGMYGNYDRTRFVGGSDIAVIVGLSKYKTAWELWREKTGLVGNSFTDSPATIRGKLFEKPVLEWFALQTGFAFDYTNRRYVDDEYGFMSCEIDAEGRDADGVQWNVEVKTASPFLAKDWGFCEDDVPPHYLTQVQWGLMASGAQRCKVVAMVGDDFRYFDIYRDEEAIAVLRRAAIDFWHHVQNKIEPEITVRDVKTKYPRDMTGFVEASQDLAGVVFEYQDVKDQIKDLESRAEELAGIIQLAIGDGVGLQINSVELCTWKAQKQNRVDAKILKDLYPAIAEECTKSLEFRVLRIKK